MLRRQSLMLFEMDERMRKIERKANAGDPNAKKRLKRMKRRIEGPPEREWHSEMRRLHDEHGGIRISTNAWGPRPYDFHSSNFKDRKSAEAFRKSALELHPLAQVGHVFSDFTGREYTVGTKLLYKHLRDDPEFTHYLPKKE